MPSLDHEFPIELIRQCPELAPRLMGDSLGVSMPEYSEAELQCADLTDVHPAEYAADTVVMLSDRAGRTVMAIIAEVQRRQDETKRLTWPAYIANLRRREACPTELVVLCPDQTTAGWCAEPIWLGSTTTSVVRPHVIGPDRMPVVDRVHQAERMPELAALSALAHAERPGVLETFMHALAHVDDQQRMFYYDYVVGGLSAAARRYWEKLMKTESYEWKTDFARTYYYQGEAKGEEKGEAKGKAEGVLAFLSARGVPVSKAEREHILGCSELDQLDIWIRRAATVDTAEELFD